MKPSSCHTQEAKPKPKDISWFLGSDAVSLLIQLRRVLGTQKTNPGKSGMWIPGKLEQLSPPVGKDVLHTQSKGRLKSTIHFGGGKVLIPLYNFINNINTDITINTNINNININNKYTFIISFLWINLNQDRALQNHLIPGNSAWPAGMELMPGQSWFHPESPKWVWGEPGIPTGCREAPGHTYISVPVDLCIKSIWGSVGFLLERKIPVVEKGEAGAQHIPHTPNPAAFPTSGIPPALWDGRRIF